MLLVSSASKSACSGLFGWMLPFLVGEPPLEASCLVIVIQDSCVTSSRDNDEALVKSRGLVKDREFLFRESGSSCLPHSLS